ncbi:MAG TPA: hypothetical protein PLG25_16135 [bacterium]|nr:hypothetical protein [bacterium]HMZ04322.1 hypothetical protein [bacterium]HNB10682.1 hypothetical protein [bacterium]HNB56377.1 hypothetical protein [bacterium]HND78595.1 hypothetical protein [bacterium]
MIVRTAYMLIWVSMMTLTACDIGEMFSDEGTDDFLESQLGGGSGGEGSATFYTQINYSGYIYIYVDNNYVGMLTQYYNSGNSPSCGANSGGAVTITNVSSGSHNLSASDGSYSWSGSFYVSETHALKSRYNKG